MFFFLLFKGARSIVKGGAYPKTARIKLPRINFMLLRVLKWAQMYFSYILYAFRAQSSKKMLYTHCSLRDKLR